MPARAVGSTTRRIVAPARNAERERRLAQRVRAPGAASLRRCGSTIGIMMIASATPPASALYVADDVRTRNAQTNTPTTIEGSPAMRSRREAHDAGATAAAVLGEEDRGADADRDATMPPSTDMSSVPTIAGATPPPSSPNGSGRSVKNARFSAGSPGRRRTRGSDEQDAAPTAAAPTSAVMTASTTFRRRVDRVARARTVSRARASPLRSPRPGGRAATRSHERRARCRSPRAPPPAARARSRRSR